MTLPLILEVTAIVGHTRLGTLSEYIIPSANFGDTTTFRLRFMSHWANTAQTDHVTLQHLPLTLADAGRRPPSVSGLEKT